MYPHHALTCPRHSRLTAVLFLSGIVFAPLSHAANIPITGVEGFHQGDSLNGTGSILTAINGSGMTRPDPDDPSTWTNASTAWQDDWQGFQVPGTPGTTWVVFDLGAPIADLATMYLWNVQENAPGNQASRGTNLFRVHHATNPTIVPPTTSGTVTSYDFASGGWTALKEGMLAVGSGINDPGEAFDVSEAAGARYIGLELLSNYGGDRVGLGEVAFSNVLDPDAIQLTDGGVRPFPPGPDLEIVPIAGIAAFHQGDSFDGAGSSLRVIDDSIIVTAPDNPMVWTHTNAWQDDWQGFEAPGVTANGTWAVLDLGAAVSALDTLLLWNVNEGAHPARGINEFNLYHATAPTVTPPVADDTADPYDFSSGGWTTFGETRSLARASGIAGESVNGTFDLKGMPPTRYLGIEILSNHGATDRVGFAHAVVLRDDAAQGPRLEITRNALGALVFTWESREEMLYNLRSETDPSNGTPVEWPIFGGQEGITATAPTNTLTISLPAEDQRFFVVEEFPVPPPPPLFEENFDGVAGPALPAGWSTAGGATAWELGTPGGAASGPSDAKSAPNCAGTGITAKYAASTIYSLITPTVAIPAGGATLQFQQYIDTDVAGDVGTIQVLDADNADALIEAMDPPGDIEGIESGWTAESFPLPASAQGKNIKIEFRFVSNDNGQEWAGFYVDDVRVTAP